LQFSITHPCFTTPHRKSLRDTNHNTYAIEVGNYFKNREGEIDEWIFGATPPGIARHPNVAYFLHIRCRKLNDKNYSR